MTDAAHRIVQKVRGEPDEPSPRIDVNVRSITLTMVAVAAAMFVLQWASEVFVPIVLSILISYALEPIVHALTRIRLPRAVASAAVVATLAGGFCWTGYALSDDAADIVASLPDAATKLRRAMRRGEPGTIENVQRAARELQRTADETAGPSPAPQGVQRVQVVEPTIDVNQYLSWGSASVVAFAGQAVLVVFFVFFLLTSGGHNFGTYRPTLPAAFGWLKQIGSLG